MMYMDCPLISIITISYNTVNTIEETILSVTNQTYSNIEYIIIDGGSTDGTIDIIKKYADKISYWISEPDKGIYDAMNKGLLVSKGEWVNFMNAGDSFKNSNVITDIFYNKIIKAQIIYGDTEIKDPYLSYISHPRPIENIVNAMPFMHQSIFVYGDLHRKNLFDIKFRSSGDYNFFMSMYEQNVKFEYQPIVIAKFDATTGMSTDNYITVHMEDAMIKRTHKTIYWYIELYINFLLFKFKRILKKILPENVVKNIHYRNLQSNKFITLS